MFVEGGEEGDDFGFEGFGDVDEILGDMAHLGGGDDPAGFCEELTHRIEVGTVAEEAGADVAGGDVIGFEGFDVLRAGFDGYGFEVLGGAGVMGFDDADVVEHPGDAADFAEMAGLEEHADFGGGAAAIVGEAFDDDGDFVRGESLVGDEFVIDLLAGEAGAFFDGAFDGVAGDGLFFGGFDGGEETGVEVGISAAGLGGDDDFLGEFAKQLAAFERAGFAALLFPLCTHIGPVIAAGWRDGQWDSERSGVAEFFNKGARNSVKTGEWKGL